MADQDRAAALHSYLKEAMRISYIARRSASDERFDQKYPHLSSAIKEDYAKTFAKLMEKPDQDIGIFGDLSLPPSKLRNFMRAMCRALNAPFPEYKEQLGMINFASLLGYYWVRSPLSEQELKALPPPSPPLPRK